MLLMKKIIVSSINEIIKNIREYKLFIILFFLYIAFFKLVLPYESNCLVKMFTGFPCPTCGMTRASFSLISFQFMKAYEFHPLVYIVPVLILIVFMKDLYVFKTLFYSKIFWSFVIVLFVSVYVVRMIYLFPDTVPLDYSYKAIIYRLI